MNLPCRYGVCDSCCQTQLKHFLKSLKMIQNCFKLICRSSSTEFFNRDGLMPLYFNVEVPEPFARGKIPQVSMTVSRTWKLRFTSNSISRSGTGLMPGMML